jgi:hypothetical protein
MQSIKELESGVHLSAPAVDRVVKPSRGDGPMLGNWVWHPFLFAAYPVLSLFAQNASQVRVMDAARLMGVVLLAALILGLIFCLILRDVRKAGLVTSLAALMFFTFDVVKPAVDPTVTELRNLWVMRTLENSAAWLLIPEIVLFVLAAYLLKVKVRSTLRVTAFLNVCSIVLLAIPLSEIVLIKTSSAGRPQYEPVPFQLAGQPDPAHLPDIYYIILDGYARSDVMKSFFDYDNSPFLERLEKQGFYIARKSIANYCQTPLSLTSSLNSVYLDDLVKGLGTDQTELSDMIGKSNIMATLRPLGYKFVTFATGFDPTEHPEADVYLSPHPFSSGFERMMIDTTPLRWVWPNPRNSTSADLSRERTFHLLERLPTVADDRAPTFTLAHVFCPHPPFVFGEKGEDVSVKYRRYTVVGGDRELGRFRDPADFARGYRGQAAFITARIEETIKQILARSPQPPIIILQSDHGSELKLDMTDIRNTDLNERMSILNTYYFPGQKYEGLYDRISPVNSFRIVLNTYFAAKLPLLPDRSFFSTWPEPYQFIDVTETVRTPDDDQPAPHKP